MVQMYDGQVVTPELQALIDSKNKYASSANRAAGRANKANAWDRKEDQYSADVEKYKKNKKKAARADQEISELLANLKAVGQSGSTTVGAMQQTSALTSGIRETSLLTSI